MHLATEILQEEFSSDKVSCFSNQFSHGSLVLRPNGVITLTMFVKTEFPSASKDGRIMGDRNTQP